MEICEIINNIEYVLKPFRGLPGSCRQLIIRDQEIMIIPLKTMQVRDYSITNVTHLDIEEGFGPKAWTLIETRLHIARKDGLI